MTPWHFITCMSLLLSVTAFSQKTQPTSDLAPSIPRMEAFANRLAQQAQQELRLGNRDDAFLYAEFALQYLQADNADARQALMDAWYCNDVIPEYLNEAEKPLEHVPKTLWMPAIGGGRGGGRGWHSDVRFPWSMDEIEMNYYLERHRGERALSFPPHPDSVFLSAFSRHTRNRLTVFGDNTAQMRDSTGILLFRIEVADSMEYVKFVGEGKHLLCRKMSGSSELRDARTGKHLLWLEKGCCSGEELEGSNWYCSARDSVVELFDLAAGVLVRSMPGLGSQAPDSNDRRVKYFKASPDFNKLVAVQFDGTATIFDLKTGNRISTFHIGENGYPMNFSANGAILGVVEFRFLNDYDGHHFAVLWDTESGKQMASFDFGQERPRKMASHFFNDRVVFLVQVEGVESHTRLAAFTIPEQRPLWTLKGSYYSLIDLINSQDVSLSKDFWSGRFAAQATAFGQFDSRQAPDMQFSPNGKWFCASGYTIEVYEASTGLHRLTLDAPHGPGADIAFSPDSRSLLVGHYKSRDKMASHAEIWDLETMTKRHDLGGQQGQIGLVSWSPDGNFALTHSVGNSLVVWDVATGQKRFEPGIPLSYNLQAAFSPDGKILAAIDTARQLLLWSFPNGKRIGGDFGREADLFAFSPDGRYIAMHTTDKFIHIHDLHTGKRVLSIRCERTYFDRIYFSNDSRLILGSSLSSHTAWEVQTGKKMMTDAGRIFEFDPKNNVLAQNRSGHIVFSDAFSRQEKARLKGLGYGQGRFSPDGNRFAAIVYPALAEENEYYQIRIFDLDMETILEKAGRVNRKKALTCAQLQDLQPEKYLDDNSLDTLSARILSRNDQECRNCFSLHFTELAQQEPDLVKAQKHYERALLLGEETSTLSYVYEKRAYWYLGIGRPERAVQDAEKALRLNPDDNFTQVVMMVGELMQGQYKNVGAKLVETISRKDAWILGSIFESTLFYAETAQPWHNDRALQGRIEKCLRLISVTDSLDKLDAKRYHLLPLQFSHIPRAELLAELDLPDSTLPHYKMGIDSLAQNATVYDQEPSIYEEAMQAFYDAHYPLADSLMAEAIRQLRDSLANQPDEILAAELGSDLHNYSWIALYAEKPLLAVSAALESLELNPENIHAQTNLGHGYLFSGQYDKAIETYMAYMEQEKAGQSILLTDFFDLRQAGIWHNDGLKAIEAILGRPLTEEERLDYGY